ncbi:MAG: class I SAM-dependent methyltransferase [Lachnospiraceae bacterium]
MNTKKIAKLEHPNRVQELNPAGVLEKIGLTSGKVLCDLGAGTGLFSLAAAAVTGTEVYALETDMEMLEYLKAKKSEEQMRNLHLIPVITQEIPLASNSCDLILLVTVLHEIEDQPAMLAEIQRIAASQARVLIIEFYKRETPLGPPPAHRMSEERVAELTAQAGWKLEQNLTLGENLYGKLYAVQP